MYTQISMVVYIIRPCQPTRPYQPTTPYQTTCRQTFTCSEDTKSACNDIFNICIRSGYGKRIYSIIVFGQQSGYEYIRYSYCQNLFIICSYLCTPSNRQQKLPLYLPKFAPKLILNLLCGGGDTNFHMSRDTCTFLCWRLTNICQNMPALASGGTDKHLLCYAHTFQTQHNISSTQSHQICVAQTY